MTNNDAILRGKEEFVTDFVNSISKILELDYKINVTFCDGFTPSGQKALACIDVLSATIYFSRIYLAKMQIEEIQKIVIHEISHMFEPSHNPEFKSKMTEIQAGTWKPTFTSGIVMIDGNKRVEKLTKPIEKEEVDKTHCNYHLCREETEVKRCIHCHRYFCEEHIKPIPPQFPNFDYPNKYNEWKNRENIHPCPDYYDYLVKKEKERIRKTEESFNQMGHMKLSRVKYRKIDNTSVSTKRKSFWKRLKNWLK